MFFSACFFCVYFFFIAVSLFFCDPLFYVALGASPRCTEDGSTARLGGVTFPRFPQIFPATRAAAVPLTRGLCPLEWLTVQAIAQHPAESTSTRLDSSRWALAFCCLGLHVVPRQQIRVAPSCTTTPTGARVRGRSPYCKPRPLGVGLGPINTATRQPRGDQYHPSDST